MTSMNLKPRAVAILVALRRGPRTVGQLADALADKLNEDTSELLRQMTGDRLVMATSTTRTAYTLTHDGLGWLQSSGLDASDETKRLMYQVYDSNRMVCP